jgi:hypothetical protein
MLEQAYRYSLPILPLACFFYTKTVLFIPKLLFLSRISVLSVLIVIVTLF